jgi:hypothetical protein
MNGEALVFGSLVPEEYRSSRAARRVMWAIIALHGGLLLLMLPDYFADNDLGFHISLARQYAEHGTYFWDHLNWAPTGRPNLQGPLLHVAIAGLGLLLGGDGWAFVRAFSLLAIFQWAAAMFTAVFFARRFGGDRAGLFAAALLSGSIYSAGSFFVGVPSGWLFVLTPWAIWFFLQERYWLSALFTAAVMYVHLGGSAVAPFGVFLAAVLTRRWRGLVRVGLITAVLTSPYLFHFLRHLDWYTGHRGHVAGSVATLIYVLAVPGLIWLATQPRRGLFLLVWAAAPVAWLFQDALRFFLQSTVVGAAIGGVFFAWLIHRYAGRRLRTALAAGLVALATVFPLSIPSLPVEIAWATGYGFPRELDWNEAEALARIVAEAELEEEIFSTYYNSLCGAMSVFTPVRQQGGHWGEVRPPVDPAAELSAGDKVYLLPIPPEDELLDRLGAAGLIRVFGGGNETSIVTLGEPRPLEETAPFVAEVVHDEAMWLAQNAVPNTMPPPADIFSDPDALPARRSQMAVQKTHAGRIQLAVLLYALATEADHPDVAAGVGRSAHGWGSVANFIGDETAIDYVDEARFEVFRENLRRFAEEVLILESQLLPSPELDEATDRLFDEFF